MTNLPADFPRPTKHPFVDGGNGECLTCGYPEPFGGLHLSEPVEEDPEPEQWWCSSCSHDRHTGACRITVDRFHGVTCGCEVAA